MSEGELMCRQEICLNKGMGFFYSIQLPYRQVTKVFEGMPGQLYTNLLPKQKLGKAWPKLT